MRRRSAKTLRRAAAASVGALLISSAAQAATVSWNNAAGGNWSGPNWTGGVGTNPPQPGDTARFAIANTYTVALDVNPSVTSTLIAGSNVTIDNITAGRTYTSTLGTTVNSGSFSLTAATPVTWSSTNNTSFNANVTVNNGNDFSVSGGGFTVGAAGPSTTLVSGSGTTLTAAGATGVANTTGSTASLTFSSGASGSLNNTINVANATGANGSITVQSGASLSANQLLLASSASVAGTATLTVTGLGTTMLQGGIGPIQVGGPIGTGTATFSSSSATTLNFGMIVGALGTTNVQSGATITTFSDVAINSGAGGGGDLIIDGSGSALTQGGALAVLAVGGASGGTAVLQLTNAGTYTTGTGAGAVTVNATGVIDVLSGTFNANGGMNVQNGGVVQRASGGTFNLAAGKTMTIQSGGDFNVAGNYAMTTTGAINITGAGSSTQVSSGTLTVGGGGQISLASGGSLTAFSERIGDASGSGSVNQSDGTHTISGGVNPLRIASAVGSTGNYTLSGGTLSVLNDIMGANAEAVGFNGTSTFTQTGGDHIVGGTNGNLVIGYAPTGVGVYTISNGNLTADSLYLGRDSGGQGTLTINAGGNVQIVDEFLDLGLNTSATGTVNANAGTLSAKGIFVGGVSSASGGTGILNIAGGSVTSSVLTGLTNSGQVRVWNTPGSAINFSSGSLSCDMLLTSGNPALFNWTGGQLTLGTGNSSSTFDASGSGSASLIKTGTGTVIVTGNSTYTGGTTVNAGALRLQHNNAAGTGAVVITNSAAQIQVSGGISVGNALTIAGGGPGGTIGTSPGTEGALHSATGNNTWAGTITLNGGGSDVTDPTLNEISADFGSTLVLTGTIQDGPPGSDTWSKSRLGNVVLSGGGPNTYTGITRTWHGTLIIEKDGALGAAGSPTSAAGNTFMLNATTAIGTSTIAFQAPASSPAGFSYNIDEWLNTGGNATTGTGAQLDNLGGDNTFAGKIGLGGFLSGGFIQSSIGVTADSLELSDSIYAGGTAPFDPRQITKLGTGTLIISGDSSLAPSNTVNNGSLVNSKFVVPAGTVVMRGVLPGVTTWDVNGGTLNVTGGTFAPVIVTARTGGQANFSDGDVHVGTLAVQATGSASIVQGSGLTARVDSFALADTFDLTDNKVASGAFIGSWNGIGYSGITGLIQTGRGDGSWNGASGMVTSMTDATTSVLTTLAVATADETGYAGGTFGGVSVSSGDVLVMYTWGGDADLNGELNGDDYFHIDSNAINNGSVFGFHNGDFDYNGTIDGDDYFIIDSNITFAQASPPFQTGGRGGGLATVPEPATMGLLFAGIMLGRRRRRS